MGTGWSQDEGSQSQPSEEPKHIEPQNSEKKPTETLLSEAKPKTVALDKATDAKDRDVKGKGSAEAQAVKLPHNYKAVIRDADSRLTDGVSADQKYQVDQKSNSKCFMLYARDLSITWGEDKRYWNWQQRNENSDVYVDVAELLNVCWLEIHGKFDTRVLSPGILYQVVFVLMLNPDAYGWEVPVNLRLTVPNGNNQQHQENLTTKPRGKWIEVQVGEFKALPENGGMLEFELFEYKGGLWKHGLVVKGVVIRPKN